MTDKICSCPLHTVNGSLVRAYLDQACEVHGQQSTKTVSAGEKVTTEARDMWVRNLRDINASGMTERCAISLFDENERLRAEIILLDKVMADARMVLLTSLHDNGQPSQTSLAALNESCRAHFEWKAAQIPTSHNQRYENFAGGRPI